MKLLQTGTVKVVKMVSCTSASNYLVFTTDVLENLIQDTEIIQTYFCQMISRL